MNRRQLLKVGAGAAALPVTAFAQSTDFTCYSPLAKDRRDAGSYFPWTFTTEFNNNQIVQVFYRTFGNPSNQSLLLVHGYPTGSIDSSKLIPYLQDDYFIAALDFPGFG